MDEKLLEKYLYELRSAISVSKFGYAEIDGEVAGKILNEIALDARIEQARVDREAVEKYSYCKTCGVRDFCAGSEGERNYGKDRMGCKRKTERTMPLVKIIAALAAVAPEV